MGRQHCGWQGEEEWGVGAVGDWGGGETGAASSAWQGEWGLGCGVLCFAFGLVPEHLSGPAIAMRVVVALFRSVS